MTSMASLTPVDVWAFVAAGAACIATGIRAEMLKPEISTFVNAPAWVHNSLTLLSIAMAVAAMSVFGSGKTTPREAMIYTVIAVAAVTLLLNLHKQRHEEKTKDETDGEALRPL